jgi:uncharacterized protein (TIGR02996 family)
MTATTTVTPAPPWSLSVLAPWAAEILDKRPDDHTARQAFADIIEEAGYPEHAERLRWMARAGRRPEDGYTYGEQWGWFVTDYEWKDRTNTLPPMPDYYVLTNPRVAHRLEPTRQAAEDALVAYLLRFDADPFAGETR